jgi:hypothetical protein
MDEFMDAPETVRQPTPGELAPESAVGTAAGVGEGTVGKSPHRETIFLAAEWRSQARLSRSNSFCTKVSSSDGVRGCS